MRVLRPFLLFTPGRLFDRPLTGNDPEDPLSSSPENAPTSGTKTKVVRHSRIEEISLRPGAEKTIKVWYNPEPEEVREAEIFAEACFTDSIITLFNQ